MAVSGQGVGPAGRGADLDAAQRPGVPREWAPDAPPGADHRASAGGSGPRPRLLSGALRRLAYGLPEHRSARWALLLGADRVDVVEHRLGAALWLVPAGAALVVGYAAVSRLLRD